jgi:hypothetical protein
LCSAYAVSSHTLSEPLYVHVPVCVGFLIFYNPSDQDEQQDGDQPGTRFWMPKPEIEAIPSPGGQNIRTSATIRSAGAKTLEPLTLAFLTNPLPPPTIGQGLSTMYGVPLYYIYSVFYTIETLLYFVILLMLLHAFLPRGLRPVDGFISFVPWEVSSVFLISAFIAFYIVSLCRKP